MLVYTKDSRLALHVFWLLSDPTEHRKKYGATTR
jgi:hypothetical protein